MIIDPDFRKVGEPVVTLQLSLSQAESVSSGLSDYLCWARGFMAAKGEDFRFEPLGVETTRELNIALKRAMREAERGKVE
jgi:hypothetical protein